MPFQKGNQLGIKYKKGQVSPNKGKSMSEGQKEKLRKARAGDGTCNWPLIDCLSPILKPCESHRRGMRSGKRKRRSNQMLI